MMTDRLDLPPRYRDQLEALLHEYVPDAEVWAYGSRVNGQSHPGSDLDLVIRGSNLEPLGTEYIELIDALEMSNIPILVQAHDWASLPEDFHREITSNYIVLKAHEWPTAKLADIVDLRLSSVDKKVKENELPVFLCNYTDVYKNSFIHADMDFMSATVTQREMSKCSLYAGDVIITKDSEKHDDIGVPAFMREDIDNLVCGYHLAILRPLPSILDGTFLFYAINLPSVQHQFHSYTNGVTRFGLRKADIGLVEIPLPPLHEQRRIAGILRDLDDKIELNRRIIQTQERMIQALFKSWFLDFDPVRAKLEGRWQPGVSLPGLPAHLYGHFPDRLVYSELGTIPDGWTVGNLSDVASERRLSTAPADIHPNLCYISLAHMPRQSIALAKWAKAEGIASNKFAFEAGDILFGKLRPYFHKVGIAPVKGVCSTDIVVVQPQIPEWLGFVLGHMSSTEFVHYTDAGSTGTRMPRTSWKAMGAYKVVTPPFALAQVFTTYSDPLVNSILSSIHTSRWLYDLRDAILSCLMVGATSDNSFIYSASSLKASRP